MLTHGPDAPNLRGGAGTAAEQAARPQLFADYVNGGWNTDASSAHPMTPLGVPVAVALEWTNSLGWYCLAAEAMDWSNGSDSSSGAETSFNFLAFGPAVITATAQDDAAVTAIPVLVRDQELAPQLTSIVPNSYPAPETTGDVEVMLTGTGFTAAARPRVVISGRSYEPSFELVSATQMRIWIDTRENPTGTGVVIFVWFPDGSTTYQRDLNPT